MSAAPDISQLPPVDRAAFFLDFDGTLIDIAATPDGVHVPGDLGALLNSLSARADGALALVSGRSAADVAGHLAEFDDPIVGGHGAEWRQGGDIRPRIDVDAADLEALRDAAHRFATDHAALLVEEKPTGVVLHYRAAPDLGATVTEKSQHLAEASAGFEAHPAKMAVELRPRGVGKDLAVADLMASAPFKGRVPVVIGDDTTDEPAMDWAQRHGGLAIKVGSGDSVAAHRLPDPSAVRQLLSRWP